MSHFHIEETESDKADIVEIVFQDAELSEKEENQVSTYGLPEIQFSNDDADFLVNQEPQTSCSPKNDR